MRTALNTIALNGELDPVYGTGTCTMSMLVFGVGNNTVVGTGTCTIEMGVSGDGKVGVSGNGTCAITMEATGSGLIGVSGTGNATMTMTARHGIPDPHLIPDAFNPAHPSRLHYDDN